VLNADGALRSSAGNPAEAIVITDCTAERDTYVDARDIVPRRPELGETLVPPGEYD